MTRKSELIEQLFELRRQGEKVVLISSEIKSEATGETHVERSLFNLDIIKKKLSGYNDNLVAELPHGSILKIISVEKLTDVYKENNKELLDWFTEVTNIIVKPVKNELSLKTLVDTFNAGKDAGHNFFACRIQMDGFPKNELQLNPMDNLEEKIAYMEKTYDENLQNKFSPVIRIVNYATGSNVEDIMEILFPEEV